MFKLKSIVLAIQLISWKFICDLQMSSIQHIIKCLCRSGAIPQFSKIMSLIYMMMYHNASVGDLDQKHLDIMCTSQVLL